MRKIINKLKKFRKKIKDFLASDYQKARFRFYKYYDKAIIKENEVLFQSYGGTSISGNPYYILKELCENDEYAYLSKYVVVRQGNFKSIQAMIEKKEWKNVNLIILNSKDYLRKLTECKYLVNNVTFPEYFVKGEKQIYVNTWHGTPLKHLGRKVNDFPNAIGNVQRNFLMADYLLHPNEFTYEIIERDYMLKNYFKGKHVISGYPRNTIFHDNIARENLKRELNLENKRVLVYMPTWRGKEISLVKTVTYINYFLFELDKSLDENTIVFVKIHSLAESKIKLSELKHIKRFPSGYETYEVLNIADCLITDYSSVMFDFMNTGKEIVLYAYDEEEYLKDRGMYLEFHELPFKIFNDVKDMVQYLSALTDKKVDYKKINNLISFDNINTSKKVCSMIFNNDSKELKVIDSSIDNNGKKNVLIFGGALLKNGITTAFLNLCNYIDLSDKNVMVTFYTKIVEKNRDTVKELSRVDYMPIQGAENMTYMERICFSLYFKYNISLGFITKRINNIYKNSIKRLYPSLKFDYVVHFSGYERKIYHLFGNMDAEKILFVHSDFTKEMKIKTNLHLPSLKYALNKFDKIVLVREALVKGIKEFIKKEDNLYVVHNINDIKKIYEKSELAISFNKDTWSMHSIDELEEILNNKNYIKFINIARYSLEKGLDQLINAFEQVHKIYSNSRLIIVGGYGNEFEKIKSLVNSLNLENEIILIRSLSNPYPILKKSDAFVLSSHYEGLPMTIMEALILEKEVISTNIEGPREFLENGLGYLVEDSVDGLMEGMSKYIEKGSLGLKRFDAEKFNKCAIEELENLFQ